MATVAVIPARFASTRFPGKPLAEIDGVPMIVRVARRVKLAKRIDKVAIATDHHDIQRVVEDAGFQAVMTPAECSSGTERVGCAIDVLQRDVKLPPRRPQSDAGGDPAKRAVPTETWPEIVVNVQGDEPLIDPADIDALVEAMTVTENDVCTLARPIDDPRAFASPHVVKVVATIDGDALYFSRAPIPHGAKWPLQHIGIYAFRVRTLRAIGKLPPSPLEAAENLEQLRWLENGLSIRVALAVSRHPSVAVDVPADIDRVVKILRSERS